jgi:hypothetical protein
MHGRAHQHLDRFQIHQARLTHAREEGAQQLLYFPRDFLLDGVRRFFSCSLSGCSSTGRRRQIFSFTSRKERLSLEFAELSGFPFRLAHRRRCRQGFADGFALDLVGKPQRRTVAGVVGLSAMTRRFPAAADDSADRTGPKIAQPGKLRGELGTLLFQ